MSKRKSFGRRSHPAIGLLLLLIGTWHCKGRTGNGGNERDAGHSGKGHSLVYKSETEKRKKITLPDGTDITMNAGTVIRISPAFNGRDRALWLEGEALFDVRGDAGKPFIVHTKNLKILVLGTRFKVDANPETAGEEVDLLSGKLQVMKSYHSDTDNGPETIETGEMVMINRDIDLMEKEKMDGSEMKAWDAGK